MIAILQLELTSPYQAPGGGFFQNRRQDQSAAAGQEQGRRIAVQQVGLASFKHLKDGKWHVHAGWQGRQSDVRHLVERRPLLQHGSRPIGQRCRLCLSLLATLLATG